MALRASTSPNKDGMHTPAKQSDLNKNSLNRLKLNILTSTALRPRAISHAGLGLNETDISEINSPYRANTVSRELASFTQTEPRAHYRKSASHLDKILGSINKCVLPMNDVADDADSVNENAVHKFSLNSPGSHYQGYQDLSSLGILRQSEMISPFDTAGSHRFVGDEVDAKSNKNHSPEKIQNSARDTCLESNSSFDLSNFLTSSQKCDSFRPTSLPNTFLDNIDFKPAESSVVREMFKKAEEEFQTLGVRQTDPSLTFASPSGDARKSWVSPEKRAQLDGKRLTIGQYFQLKSSDLKELSQSLDSDESFCSQVATALPRGPKPEYIQGFKETIDLTENTRKNTITLDDTQNLDHTLVPDIEALSISTIANLMDDRKGSDTVVRELLYLANKSDEANLRSPRNIRGEAPLTPKKAGSRLPRPQSKVVAASKPSTVRSIRGTGHLVCLDTKIRGQKVVAHACNLSVTVVNEGSDTLQCELVDLADNGAYSVTNQSQPVMLLSKRKATLQGTIIFHQPGEIEVNVGVQTMDIRSKKRSSVVAPPLKVLVDPQIYLKTPYKDGIDFGLHAEDTKATSFFEIINLSPDDIPICISIDQDAEENSYLLMVPPEERGGEVRLSACMAFSLPGTHDRKNATSVNIGIVFFSPNLSSVTGDNLDVSGTTAKIEATLKIETSEHEGAHEISSHPQKLLAKCPIIGRVGLTQLLVTSNTLTLIPGVSQELAVKNAGVVPLSLQIVPYCRFQRNTQEEKSIHVEPSEMLLLPGEDKHLFITWVPDIDNAANFICDLHLMYDNLAADHVVTLECKVQVAKDRLPLRTTRPHVAWGSTRPGDTSKQTLGFQNVGSSEITVGFRTVGDYSELPFKILSDTDEVTSELEIHFGPQQKKNLTVMFSPTRLGPACAEIAMLPKSSPNFLHKIIPLSGFGGHSKIILRQVSTSLGNKWITLKPDFGDAIVGNLTLYNDGTIPAFVKITGSLSIPVTENMSLTCNPDVLFVPPKESVDVSVKLSGVRSVMSRTPSSEVKTLAALHISTINEVTRRRLRKVLPTLSSKDLINFLKSENGAGMNSLVSTILNGEEKCVSESNLEQLRDFSGASASFLTKDLEVINVELRAEGTGAGRALPELDTIESFVSIMDKTANETDMNQMFNRDMYKREWDLDQKEVTLQMENNFKAAIQATNFTEKPLSLEVVCDEGLEATPTHPCLAAYKTAIIFIAFNHDAHLQMIVDKEVVVYSKNDRVSVRVRVLPKPRHRMVIAARKPLEPSFASCSSSVPPPSPAHSNYSSSSSSSSGSGSGNSWHSILSAHSDDEKSSEVYTDTKTVVFPYTPKGHESTVTLTIFNRSSLDKNVCIIPPGEPFWITDNCSLVIPAKWHVYVRLYFRPTIARDVSSTLKIKVEGYDKSIIVQLQGLTDNH
ncbi:uncharacterized protein LOC132204044 isoform X2 [Neocloeon triangulifer]|uniref:uncharacterized protein LOC132204044 isoform X2 n=1 Tax=Neocloeon triangulifer TaxID=2078957 RepID=UPI00286F6E44|nr:uncharacterized protein LOC132204044 isoform X2 [Neocloeon triangulifer]